MTDRFFFLDMLIAFHKPFGVVSQFSEDGSGRPTLADFGLPARVYPIGRLDADSEGLLLLSDEAGLNTRLLNPSYGHRRVYLAQVERVPDEAALVRLREGVSIRSGTTLPCHVRLTDPPTVPVPRDPPIRYRKNVPTAWLEIELIEGKNRQIRRMTASVNHPTLRLIRVQIGSYALGDLSVGHWKELNESERALLFISRRKLKRR
jgi:23S rRNA pseudouridine2457 synthase